MARPILKSLLIVDPDQTWLDSLTRDPLAGELDPVCVSRKKDFRDLIADPHQRFRGIFVNARCYWPSVVSVIQSIREHHPATPIFLLHDGVCPFTQKELSRLAVHGDLAKPVSLGRMREKIPGAATAVNLSAHAGRPSSAPASDEDAQYLPVAIEEFFHGLPAFFDVFVKLPTGKYVKVLETKDAFPTERVQKYLEGGATHLYLRRQPLMRCLEYCGFMNENLVVHPEVSAEMRMLYTASVGEDFLKFVEQGKVDESNLEPAYSYMNRLFALVKHQPSDRKQLIETYLGHGDAMEHAVGISFACALMTAPLGIQSPNVFRQLGLAAIFHDIGLMALDPSLSHEDTARMTPEQKAVFEKHPSKSAELAGSVRGVDSTVIQAIEQHHERRDGSGFPRKAKADSIQIFAEVVGICDEFVRLLQRQKREPSFQALKEMEATQFNRFSFPVIDAFKKTFMGEDGAKNLGGVRKGMAGAKV